MARSPHDPEGHNRGIGGRPVAGSINSGDGTPPEAIEVTVEYTREQIAAICHNVNAAYCLAIGDDSQPSWDDAPDWQKESAMLGVDLHMDNDVGPQASHESWMRQKLDDGWVYGEVKDPDAKTHPCIVNFKDLPQDQQAKDFIFRSIVHNFK